MQHRLQAKNTNAPHGRWEAGFSMTEMVIVISILGVLAGVAIVSFSGGYEASREVLARDRMETLNRGLDQFAQNNYEMIFTQRKDSGADELVVLRTLQYRNPKDRVANTGAPYVTPYYNPTISSEKTDYRIRWTGRLYELLRPGETGTGMKMLFDSSDMTKAFVFPPNFQMAGR